MSDRNAEVQYELIGVGNWNCAYATTNASAPPAAMTDAMAQGMIGQQRFGGGFRPNLN